MTIDDLRNTDIYLIDQLLKGRIQPYQKVLDIGCGSGRNLIPLEKMNCDLYGIDLSPQALQTCQMQLSSFKNDQFYCGNLMDHPFQKNYFDLVICNALFHFTDDQTSFMQWANKAWEALKPGGLFFARLSTKIGLPNAQVPGFKYLATEQDLIDCEKQWQARRLDPLKTTLVESARTMTTWVLTKS